MKKIFYTCILLLTALQSFSQSFEWAYTTGYSNFNYVSSIKRDHVGDIYLASYKDSAGIILNTRIEKRNSSNAVLWNIDFQGGAVIRDIEINSQNHAVFAGSFSGELIAGQDTLRSPLIHSAFLIETFENGSYFWAVTFNPANDDFSPTDIFIDAADNIYLAAELAGSTSHGFCSFHKLDLWGVPMQDEFNDNTEVRTFTHIIADNAGNVYLSGTCGNFATFDSLVSDPSFSYQNFLVKYDSSFKAQWLITRSYITFDHNNGLGTDGQSLYWTFLEASSSADSIKLVKSDLNGQILIDQPGPLVGSFFPYINSGTDPGGNTLLTAAAFNKIYLYRYDNQFNLQWEDSLLAQVSGFAPLIQSACYDSSFYIGSRFYADSLYVGSILLTNSNATAFNAEVFFAKWSFQNNVSVLSPPGNMQLNVYPNPASKKINFYYPENKKATLTVKDLFGRSCYDRNIQFAGEYEIVLDGIKPGIYFVQLSGSDFRLSQRLVLNN